jgi:hypothetical protein
MSPKGARITASTLILIAAVALVVSMGVSWWGASATGGGHAVVLGFFPGSHYEEQTNFNSSTPSYVSSGLVHVGELYEAVLGVAVVATLAGFIGAALAYLGTFWGFKPGRHMPMTFLFALISLVGAVGMPVAVAAAQPSAFNSDSTTGFGGAGCGASPNPCSSFWNSMSANGVTVSWGADVGWYLAIAAGVLLLVAFLLLWRTRAAPQSGSMAAGSASSTLPPAPSSGMAGGPDPAGASVPGGPSQPAPESTASYCPKCGNPMTYVAQYSRWYCLTERTYL